MAEGKAILKTFRTALLIALTISTMLFAQIFALQPVYAAGATPYYDPVSGTTLTSPNDTTDVTTDSTGSVIMWDETQNSWYVATGIVTISGRIQVSGNVNLILADGCTFTAGQGITVSQGNSLTIYGGSAAGTGVLDAGWSGSSDSSGNPTNVTTSSFMAGIGGDGSAPATATAGAITLNGGVIYAAGGNNGAGVGGGANGDGGTIIINNGSISASGGGWGGAGIGGGSSNPEGTYNGAGGNITITGGTVTAQGSNSTDNYSTIYNVGGGAGIGGAGANNYDLASGAQIASGAAGNITISGSAIVTATGGNGQSHYGCGGAGIGSGGAGGDGSLVGSLGSIDINTSYIAFPYTVNATGGIGSTSNQYQNGSNVGYGGGYPPPLIQNAGVQMLPVAPTSLTATAGSPDSGQVTLNWTQPTNLGSVTLLYRIIVDGTIYADNVSYISNYIVSSLSAGSHTFVVRAINQSAIGPQSDAASAMVSSSPTATNVNANASAPVVGTAITGTYTYTAGVGTGAGDDSSIFQWYRSTSATWGGATPTAITSATSTTYTPTGADVGYYLFFQVTPSNGTISGTAVQSAASGQVGLVVSLSVDQNSTTGTATIDSGAGYVVVYSSTSPALAAVLGNAASVAWTVSSGGGTFANSASINPGYTLPTLNESITGPITITATFTPSTAPSVSAVNANATAPRVGTQLTGTYTYTPGTGIGAGASASTFQWFRSTTATWGSATAISGATTASYTPTGADVGQYLFFQVTPTNGTLTGTVVQSPASGQVGLVVSLSVTQNGTNGTATIGGGTVPVVVYSSTSPVVAATLGDAASVTWTVSSGGGTFTDALITNPVYSLPAMTTSLTGPIAITATFTASTPPVATNVNANAAAPRVGTTVTGSYTYTAGIGIGAGTDASTFQWYRSTTATWGSATAISGATSTSYTPTGADVGQYLFFQVTPSSGTLAGTPVQSVASGQVGLAVSLSVTLNSTTGTATIGGGAGPVIVYSSTSPVVAATLFNAASVAWTVSGGGSFTDASIITPGYTLPTLNTSVTGPITITATFTPSTAPSASAVNANAATPRVGTQLTGTYTYTPGTGVGAGSSASTFQWYRSSSATWGTASATLVASTISYTPTGADVGQYLFFQVTPSSGFLAGTPVQSVASGQVGLVVSLNIVANGTTGTATIDSGAGPVTIFNSTSPVVTATLGDANNVAWTASAGGGTFTNSATTNPGYALPTLDTSVADQITITATFSATHMTIPEAPTAVSATLGNSQVTVSFSAPSSDGGSPLTGYIVSVAPSDGGTPITVSGSSSPITVTGLSPGTAYDITVTATNAIGSSPSSSSVQITATAPLQITTTSLADAMINTAYSQAISYTGYPAPASWSLTGSLPSGLSFDTATGVISGTPTVQIRNPVTLTVTANGAPSATQTFTLILRAPVYPGVVTKDFGVWSGSGTASAYISLDYYTDGFQDLVFADTFISVPDTAYIATQGSTIITFYESYLSTLAPGTYYFVAEFNDYETRSIWLTITGNRISGNAGGGPATGDDTYIPFLTTILAIVSALCLMTLLLYYKFTFITPLLSSRARAYHAYRQTRRRRSAPTSRNRDCRS